MKTWIDGIQLTDRWKVAPHSILEAVEDGMKVYESLNGDIREISVEDFKHAFKRYSFNFNALLETVFFNLDEVADFEIKKGDAKGPLSANDRRRFGQLKAERDTFKKAIEASVNAGLWCQSHSPVIKPDCLNFIDQKYPGLPQTTIDEIWRSIPPKFKSGSGRPRKSAKK